MANRSATRDEVNRLIATINIKALCVRASAVRGGIPCKASSLEHGKGDSHALIGSMNHHIPLTFTDGEEWICCIRRSNASSPPQELQNRIILSEVATLQFLSFTKVPVPRIHDFALEENPVGVGYILMDKLRGHPLDLDKADAPQKRRFLEQFADIFAELSSHPFASIGCLTKGKSGRIAVGPLVTERTARRTEDNKLRLPGPYRTAIDYRREVLEIHLEHIRNREAYVDQRLDAFAVHRFLLDNVSSLAKVDLKAGEKFYMKHIDDKGDHILVDDEFNIVGIINWEWAQTVPMSEAFAAPLFMLSVGQYYSGDNTLSKTEELFMDVLEEKGYSELASCVRQGRTQHRIGHCIEAIIRTPIFQTWFSRSSSYLEMN